MSPVSPRIIIHPFPGILLNIMSQKMVFPPVLRTRYNPEVGVGTYSLRKQIFKKKYPGNERIRMRLKFSLINLKIKRLQLCKIITKENVNFLRFCCKIALFENVPLGGTPTRGESTRKDPGNGRIRTRLKFPQILSSQL